MRFALPGDFGQNNTCARMQLDQLSSGAVSPNALFGLQRYPTKDGGYDSTATNGDIIAGSSLPFRDFSSWILPPDWRARFPYGCTNYETTCPTNDLITPYWSPEPFELCPDSTGDCAARQHLAAAFVGASCPEGLAGVDCRASAFLTALEGGAYEAIRMPVMTVRAVDEEGRPVPNIRVRLRALTGIYPDMPRDFVAVISCGLNGVDDGYNDVHVMDGADNVRHRALRAQRQQRGMVVRRATEGQPRVR